jgi:putative redox protein
MLTVMGIKARSLGYDLEGIKVDVEKKMKADPRRVGGINLTYNIPQTLKLSEKDIAILKNIAINCPVQKSIHPDIEVNIDWGTWGN